VLVAEARAISSRGARAECPGSVALGVGWYLRAVGARARFLRLAALVGLVVVIASACRVELSTTIEVGQNGQGTITQGIGFDAAALKRVGDPARAVRADDLIAAGWVIDPVVVEGELTWLRIHHDFTSVDEGNALLAQLSGPAGPYRDLLIARSDGLLTSTVSVSGEIDTSAGLSAFADDALAGAFGGDPSGGLLATIEAEEGQPPAEMLGFDLTIDAAGKSRTFAADFTKSEAHTVKVSSTQSKFLSLVGTTFVMLLAVFTIVVLALRWRRRRFSGGRFMRSTPRGTRFR